MIAAAKATAIEQIRRFPMEPPLRQRLPACSVGNLPDQ
jgi:hypothetical protein